MEALQAKFHNIGGSTLAQRMKNFHFFVRDLNHQGTSNLDDFVKNLTPSNRLEEIFQIKLLSALGRHQELFNIYLNDRRFLNKIILKRIDLQRVFTKISAENFVNFVCPKLSSSTKMKLINRLSLLQGLNHTAYHKAVLKNYGIYMAAPFLVLCGDQQLLKTSVKDTGIVFTERQLITLHEKYPGFLKYYFTMRAKQPFAKCHMLARHLLLKDLKTLSVLLEFGVPTISRQGFKKLVGIHKLEIIKNPDRYSQATKLKDLCRLLTPAEYCEFLKNSLPKSLDELKYSDATKYIKVIPRKERGDLLFKAYKARYDIDLVANANTVPNEMLKALSLEDRLKFDLEDRIELNSTEKSIPLLKEKINVADRDDRYNLIVNLISTCVINEDSSAAKETLKYFWKRHKNDDTRIREGFLVELLNNFPVETWEEEYWVIMRDLVVRFELNHDYFDGHETYLQKHLLYKLSNGLEYKDALKAFVKNAYYWSAFLPNLKKYERQCIMGCVDMLTGNVADEQMTLIQYFNSITDFNKRNPREKISIYDYPGLIKEVLKCFNIPHLNYHFRFKIKDILLHSTNKVIGDEAVFEHFFKTNTKVGNRDVSFWILRNRPAFLMKHMTAFFDHEKPDFRLYYEISKIPNTPLHTELVERATSILASPESDCSAIISAIQALVFEPNFLNLVEKYNPSLEENAEDSLTNRKIQKTVMNCFKLLENTKSYREILLPYCRSSQKKLALGTLNAMLNHTPEFQLGDLIFPLLNEDFAVMKSAVCSSSYGCLHFERKVLETAWKQKSEETYTKFILRHTFVLFCSNVQMWDICSQEINSLHGDETRCLRYLTKLNKVPRSKFVELLEILWKHDIYEDDENVKYHLLKHLTPENVDFSVPNDTFIAIIRDCLSDNSNKCLEETNEFVYNYLLFSNDQDFERQFNLLCNSIFGGSNSSKKIQIIHDLITKICDKSLRDTDHKSEAKRLITNLKTALNNLQILPLQLEIDLLVNLTSQYLQFDFDGLESYVISQQSALISKYGAASAAYYRAFAKNFVKTLYEVAKLESENVLVFAENLLQKSDAAEVKCLVLELLPHEVWKSETVTKKYFAVIDQIKSNSSPVVDVHLASYMRQIVH